MSNPDNVEVFTKLCQAIHDRLPNLGYVHMVESRGDPAKLANWATESGDAPDAETLNPFRKIFEGGSTAFLSAGGYTPELAREVAGVHGGGVVFGRVFISSESCSNRLGCLAPHTFHLLWIRTTGQLPNTTDHSAHSSTYDPWPFRG